MPSPPPASRTRVGNTRLRSGGEGCGARPAATTWRLHSRQGRGSWGPRREAERGSGERPWIRTARDRGRGSSRPPRSKEEHDRLPSSRCAAVRPVEGRSSRSRPRPCQRAGQPGSMKALLPRHGQDKFPRNRGGRGREGVGAGGRQVPDSTRLVRLSLLTRRTSSVPSARWRPRAATKTECVLRPSFGSIILLGAVPRFG